MNFLSLRESMLKYLKVKVSISYSQMVQEKKNHIYMYLYRGKKSIVENLNERYARVLCIILVVFLSLNSLKV